MEIVAFIITIISGVIAEGTIGVAFNMPGIGPIVSITVMGSFILWSIRRKK